MPFKHHSSSRLNIPIRYQNRHREGNIDIDKNRGAGNAIFTSINEQCKVACHEWHIIGEGTVMSLAGPVYILGNLVLCLQNYNLEPPLNQRIPYLKHKNCLKHNADFVQLLLSITYILIVL